jgi:pimeloyl-[acyl-carrier protein] methyl ester esterase
VKLLFVHGWGFDASLWDAVIACLPDADAVRADRGYFGGAAWPTVEGPCLAVTHSFGSMALLADPPADCRGLLAINGFDRFAEGEGRAGVPPRVIDRMLARLDGDPVAVLREFHARLGSDGPQGTPDTARLRQDLAALRSDDRSVATANFAAPIIALDGADDPLLFAAMRAGQFAAAADLQRETLDAGHLLPLTHPELCAAWIERLRVAA